jgi:ATP-binding cassette subfamily B (MDR/TAP) protein 1
MPDSLSPASAVTPQTNFSEKDAVTNTVLPGSTVGVAETAITIEDDNPSSPSTYNATKATRPEPQPGFNNFWRILRFSTTTDRFLMATGTVFSVGAGATLPLMNVIFGKLVGSFSGYSSPDSSVSKNEFLASANRNALYFLYLFIAKFVLGYISIYSFRMSGIRISATIRMAYLVALFKQPISVIDRLPPGAATDSLTTVANTIQVAISDKLGTLIQSISLIISAYAIAFIYSWPLTLVSSSVILFVFVVYGSTTPAFIKIEHSLIESNSNASAVAGEVFKSVRTVKSLCAENAVTARYAKWTAQSRERGLKKSPFLAVQYAPAFSAIYANMALTFWYGVKLYSKGTIADIGVIVT